jgi:C2 domain
LHIKRVTVVSSAGSGMNFVHVALRLPECGFSYDTKEGRLEAPENSIAWPNLPASDTLFDCDANCIKQKSIEVAVMSRRTHADKDKGTVIGTAMIPLIRAADPFGGDCERSVELMGNEPSSKSPGKVYLIMQLTHATTVVKEVDLGLPADFTVGVMSIKTIECTGLSNTELNPRDPPDPFAVVSFGDWSDATATLNNAGVNPKWPQLDMHFEVNSEQLLHEKLKVEVRDQNEMRRDVPMGSCVFTAPDLKKLCAALDDEAGVYLEAKMSAQSKMSTKSTISGAIAGNCRLNVSLKRTTLDALQSHNALPDSKVTITEGELSITSIDTVDIKGWKSLGWTVRLVILLSFYTLC